MPPAERKNPYSFRRHEAYVYKSLRVLPEIWGPVEALAAREYVSVNSACLALLFLALELDASDEGRQRIHEACAQWRTRWERKLTTKRRRRARVPEETGRLL